MTNPDPAALAAELRECVKRGSYSGGGYLYVEVAPEDASAAAALIESQAAEIAEAHARAERAEAKLAEVREWAEGEGQFLQRPREMLLAILDAPTETPQEKP